VLDRNTEFELTTGATPVLRAAKAADVPAIQLLLKHGALIDLPNIEGVTPLMAASGSGRDVAQTRGRYRTERDALEATRVLIEAGANVNAARTNGETALHGAALRGWNDVVKLLAAHGAQLDAQAKTGLTPIDFAMGRYQPGFLEPKPKEHPKTAALLKELGAKLEHPNLPPWPGVPTPTITASVPE